MAPVALEYEQTERTLFFGITTSLDRQYSNAHQFYAVDNTVIAKYEIASGRQVDRWTGPSSGLVRHLNSCLAHQARILCSPNRRPSPSPELGAERSAWRA